MAQPDDYEIPADVIERRDQLADRLLKVMGRCMARTLSTIADHEAQELAAAYWLAMQETVTKIQQEDAALTSAVVQTAYAAGKTAGTMELGRQLGMIPEPTTTPEITH